MRVLIIGATGATGKNVTNLFLEAGYDVRVVVREAEKLPEDIRLHENISIIKNTILDMKDDDIEHLVRDCDAVISCLGHTLSFRGLFGKPRRLVAGSVRRLCKVIQATSPQEACKLVLMNSAGCQNKDATENISFGQHCILYLLRLLLPPHVDNEQALDYLRTEIGQSNTAIEWVIVRPDNLTNAKIVSSYAVHPSPIRSAIFNAGETSRINVAHFMVSLISQPALWSRWKGQMPVIYNDADDK